MAIECFIVKSRGPPVTLQSIMRAAFENRRMYLNLTITKPKYGSTHDILHILYDGRAVLRCQDLWGSNDKHLYLFTEYGIHLSLALQKIVPRQD
jgi:hypothetical protein